MLKDFPRPQALNPADSSPDTSRWPLLLKPEKKDIKRGLGESGIHVGDYDCVCVCVSVCVCTRVHLVGPLLLLELELNLQL